MLNHNHLRTHRGLLIKLDHLVIQHADAAGGHGLADGARRVGAVDAVHGVALALIEIEGAGTERVRR